MNKNWNNLLLRTILICFLILLQDTEGMVLERLSPRGASIDPQAKTHRQGRFIFNWLNGPRSPMQWNRPSVLKIRDMVHETRAVVIDMFMTVLSAAQQMNFDQSMQNGPIYGYEDSAYGFGDPGELEYPDYPIIAGGDYSSYGGGDYESYYEDYGRSPLRGRTRGQR